MNTCQYLNGARLELGGVAFTSTGKPGEVTFHPDGKGAPRLIALFNPKGGELIGAAADAEGNVTPGSGTVADVREVIRSAADG